jgi:hypothetical protein
MTKATAKYGISSMVNDQGQDLPMTPTYMVNLMQEVNEWGSQRMGGKNERRGAGRVRCYICYFKRSLKICLGWVSLAAKSKWK